MSERAPSRRCRRTATAPPVSPGWLLALLLLGPSSGCSDAPPASRPETAPLLPPGAATPSPVANLSPDILPAPPAPALEVTAESGALRFRWQRPPDGTHSLRLHVRDERTGVERALPAEDVTVAGERRVALSPHRTPWRDLTYRLEACSPDGCLSSRREPIDALAGNTFRHLQPALVADGERYGEALAISADGALLAIALPTAGRVALWFTRTDAPRRGGTVDVSGLGTVGGGFSRTRRLALTVAGDSDTLAVLSTDGADGRNALVGVFSRLGEGWFETARFAAFETPASAANVRTTLRLSRDGRRLLAARVPVAEADAAVTEGEAPARGGGGGELILHTLDERDRWQARRPLHTPEDPSGRLVAVAASADLRRVFVAATRDGAPPLLRLHADAHDWQGRDVMSLIGFEAGAPLALAADALGTRLAVGGFEPRRTGRAAPVLWRYRIDETADTLSGSMEDSIVLGYATGEVRTSALVADERLDAAVMRWSTGDVSALASVVRDARGRWRKALELPSVGGARARLTNGAADDSLAIDADGERLAIGVTPGGGPAVAPDAGSVLLLR